jgi:hypothetical protein
MDIPISRDKNMEVDGIPTYRKDLSR